jgi:hypothetical protein
MHGYTVIFWVAAGVFVVGALVVRAMMPGVRVEAEHGVAPVSDGVAA